MAKNDKKAYELSESEQRDLVTLIQQGKALPEKYRFILFEDKREVELAWNGKNRDVCTMVLPFQTLEHVDEPRAETKTQGDLFDSRGRQTKGWTNKLVWGDNKLILSSLKAGPLRQQIEDAGGLKPLRHPAGFSFHDTPPPTCSAFQLRRLGLRDNSVSGFPLACLNTRMPYDGLPTARNQRDLPSSSTHLFLHTTA